MNLGLSCPLLICSSLRLLSHVESPLMKCENTPVSYYSLFNLLFFQLLQSSGMRYKSNELSCVYIDYILFPLFVPNSWLCSPVGRARCFSQVKGANSSVPQRLIQYKAAALNTFSSQSWYSWVKWRLLMWNAWLTREKNMLETKRCSCDTVMSPSCT